MKTIARQVIATVSLLFAATAAQAVPIVGLVNTGVSTVAGQQDPNYALSKLVGTASITNGKGWEAASIHSAWLPNNAAGTNSEWLSPEQVGTKTFDPSVNGVYLWSLTFDLSAYDKATASFSGRYRTDNMGSVALNGQSLGADVATSAGNFRVTDAWKSFSVGVGSSLFNAGLNTLVFTVTNVKQSSGNPSGLRVEFLQTSVVPEPEAYGLALAGLVVVGVSRSRRRRG